MSIIHFTPLEEQRPEYYQRVNIKLKDSSVLIDWHLLSDGDNLYFGSLNEDGIHDYSDVQGWTPYIKVVLA